MTITVTTSTTAEFALTILSRCVNEMQQLEPMYTRTRFYVEFD